MKHYPPSHPSQSPAIDSPTLDWSPEVPHRCRIMLQGIYARLKSAERSAADLLVHQPEVIRQESISGFARKAGCSQATAVRLAKRLGYQGFPELRDDFLGQNTRPLYEGIRLTRDDDPHSVAAKVFEASAQGLRDTLQVLERPAYEKALEALLAAERLAFIGIGNAAVVARDACLKFLRIGVPCFESADPDVQIFIVTAHLRPGDLLVVVSYSGATRPLLHAVKCARQSGATILLITNFPGAPLTRHADIVLQTAVFQEHSSREVLAKRIAQLCIIESLYVNYLLRKGSAPQRQLDLTNTSLSLNKIH